MENIKLEINKSLGFISKDKLAAYEPKVRACMETLEKVQDWETTSWLVTFAFFHY
mgnify:CR=1 FL=1